MATVFQMSLSYLEESIAVAPLLDRSLFNRSLFSRSLRSNRSLFGLQDLLGRSSRSLSCRRSSRSLGGGRSSRFLIGRSSFFRSGSSWSFRDRRRFCRSRNSWGHLRSSKSYRSLGLLDFSLRSLIIYKGEAVLLGGVDRVDGRVDIARGLMVDRGGVINRGSMINRGVDNWLGNNHGLVGGRGNNHGLVWGGGHFDNRGRHIGCCLWISRHTIILDISNITLGTIGSVGDNLDSTVRQVDAVCAIGVKVVPAFLEREDRTRLFSIIHTILVTVDWWKVLVDLSWCLGCWGRQGGGQEGEVQDLGSHV